MRRVCKAGCLPNSSGLVIYIVLGMVALKRGRTRGIRITAAFSAAVVLAYIFGVAATKSTWGPLAGWI